MNKILSTIMIVLMATVINAQQKTSVITKVTATWCPNCGTWGWDYFEELKDMYQNNPNVTLLGVHHSGDLRNPTSEWFADNLGFSYQPEFFHNHEDLNVNRNNWSDKVDDVEDFVSDYQNASSSTELSFVNAYVENGQIIANVYFDATSKSAGENYFALYVFENNVRNNQSSRGMSFHPNVLRAVISDSAQGDLFTGEDDNGERIFTQNYSLDLDPNWDVNNLGLLGVMWVENNGDLVFENGTSIFNIGLLSSTQETLDAEKINVRYDSRGIELNVDLEGQSQLLFFNSHAQLIEKQSFTGRTYINTAQWPAGIYSIQVINNNKYHTQQVLIAH